MRLLQEPARRARLDAAARTRLRPRGVYLITGGLGGLGGALEAQGSLNRGFVGVGVVGHGGNLTRHRGLELNHNQKFSLAGRRIRMTAQPVPLDVVVQSNAKLLKAVIALLSLKDDHMLDELKTIFTVAARGGSEIGDAAIENDLQIGARLFQAIDARIVERRHLARELQPDRRGRQAGLEALRSDPLVVEPVQPAVLLLLPHHHTLVLLLHYLNYSSAC